MPIALDGVRFVIAPGQFPPRLSYYLADDPEHIPETLSLLRAFAPAASFLGRVPVTAHPDDTDPAAAVVVSSRDWPAVVDRLRRRFPPERVVVLLNPDDDSWGYLAVARTCPDRVRELADPRVPAALKVEWLRPHMLRHAYATFDAGRPVWNPDHYFLPYRDLVRENAGAIHDILCKLADQASRDAFQLVLYGSPEDLLQHFLGRVFHEQQYVEVTHLRPGDVVLNAGIGSGWDVPFFLAHTRAAGRHLLVDPVPSGSWTTAARLAAAFGLEFHNGALWDAPGEMAFPIDRHGMMVSTRPGEEILGHTTTTVPMRTVDEIVRTARLDRLDMIKMDIEGAEPQAIRGMTETLARFRPQLAVCIYHKPEHMWDIPTYLMSRLTDYRFYVRHYSPTRFECLLYAIPVERLPASAAADPFLDAAGIDGRLLRRAWDAVSPGEPFEAALAKHAGSPPQPDRLTQAAAALAQDAGRAFATGTGTATPTADVLPAGPDLLGTGWGPDGAKTDQSWRWFGPDGTAEVFVDLAPQTKYLCRVYLYHADSQAAYDQFRMTVNGAECGAPEVSMDEGYYFVQWRIPAAAVDRGRCRVALASVPGRRKVAVYKITFRPLG